MYNSVKEMHIAIDYGLQHINSNRKQSISPYYKDMALNYAVLQYIEQKTSTRLDGRGFESDQKRYDDLKELKRTKRKTSTYKQNGINEVFAIQPDDYYKLIGSSSYVLYDKLNGASEEYDPQILNYKVLEFPNDYFDGQTYKDLIIKKDGDVIFNIANYNNFPNTFGFESKFMYVNLIINSFKHIHWERWDDSILYNYFIINDTDTDTNYSLEFTSDTTTITRTSVNKEINVLYFNPIEDVNYRIKKNELLSSLYFENIEENVQYSRNRHRKPLSKLAENRLIIEQGRDFIVPFVDIEYLVKPTLISHISGKTCEVSITREIVDLAVQRLKAYIKDEGYQQMVHENQISE